MEFANFKIWFSFQLTTCFRLKSKGLSRFWVLNFGGPWNPPWLECHNGTLNMLPRYSNLDYIKLKRNFISAKLTQRGSKPYDKKFCTELYSYSFCINIFRNTIQRFVISFYLHSLTHAHDINPTNSQPHFPDNILNFLRLSLHPQILLLNFLQFRQRPIEVSQLLQPPLPVTVLQLLEAGQHVRPVLVFLCPQRC